MWAARLKNGLCQYDGFVVWWLFVHLQMEQLYNGGKLIISSAP
jgi:hypothetical protein